MSAGLSHTTLKGRGRVMNVPPKRFTAGITTIARHDLGIETGPQVLGGDWVRDGAAVAIIKDAMSRDVSRSAPETADSFKIAAERVQLRLLLTSF